MQDPESPMRLTERIVYAKTWSKTFRRLILMLPDWITPNRVTVSRAALTLPLYWALSSARYWTALAIFACAMALDAVDGAIAHIKDMGTPLGAFLDPLADKVIFCGALFAVWDALPGWILALGAASVAFAGGITLVRIVRMVRIRDVDGAALARTVAAKPAGKMKTMFDVLSVALIMSGLALDRPALVDAGGVTLVIGSLIAGYVHFFHAGRLAALRPARLPDAATVSR